MEFSKLLLQSGSNYYLYTSEKDGKKIDYYIKNPKLREVVELEKTEVGLYFKYLYVLISTSLDVADILLCENDIWYEDIKDEWGFFLQKALSNELKKVKTVIKVRTETSSSDIVVDIEAVDDFYRDALNFFFNTTGEYIIWKDKNLNDDTFNSIYLMNVTKMEKENESDEDIFLFDESNFKFTPHTYRIMLDFLRKINWSNPTYDFLHGGTRYAKKYILQQEYKKRKKNNEATVDLESIVSSLIAKGQRLDDLYDYSIYLIYNLYYRLVKINEWDNTMNALHSGCIDTKKHPINYEKLNWASIIK
jgi:hypothetical protein